MNAFEYGKDNKENIYVESIDETSIDNSLSVTRNPLLCIKKLIQINILFMDVFSLYDNNNLLLFFVLIDEYMLQKKQVFHSKFSYTKKNDFTVLSKRIV